MGACVGVLPLGGPRGGGALCGALSRPTVNSLKDLSIRCRPEALCVALGVRVRRLFTDQAGPCPRAGVAEFEPGKVLPLSPAQTAAPTSALSLT